MKTDREYGKILLLETPFLSQTGTEEVKAYVQSKYNLALLSLGSYIRAHSDLEVSLINMVKDQMTEDSLIAKLRVHPPIVVGVSLYSYNLSISYGIIRRIKKEFPATHICAGGPHVNIFPKESLLLEGIDSIVLGDGEVPFLEICRRITQYGTLDQADLPAGIYTKKILSGQENWMPYVLADINKLPLPDISLLGDYKRYRDFLSGRIMGLVATSRGCPNVCHYCLSEKSRYRGFSIEHVMDTLRYYKRMGIEYVEFWDETFNSTKHRFSEFADAILEADLGLSLAIRGAVVNHTPLDILQKLRKAGLKLIQFGIETSSPRLLQYLNKHIDREKIKTAFQNCHEAGIRTVANLMINIPGQTRDEILSDFALIKEIKPTYVSISIYNWAPGTTHYEEAVKNKTLNRDFWREYAFAPVGPEPVVHPRCEVDINEVYEIRDRFVRGYYFNFSYILNYVKVVEFCEIIPAIKTVLLMLKSIAKNMFSRDKRELVDIQNGNA